MKIRCPQCDTTYDVSEEIANSGAQVQCAKCTHVFAAIPVEDPEPEAEQTLPERATEPETAAQPDTDITFEALPEPEPAEELLNAKEKDFFASFGEKIAKEEALKQDEMQQSPPVADSDADINEEPDIGWSEPEEPPEAGKSEPEAESTPAAPDIFDDFDAIDPSGDEDLFADTKVADTPLAEPVAAVQSEEPILEAEPVQLPGAPDPELGPQRFSNKMLMGWGGLAASLLLIFGAAALFRVPIVKALPGMAGIYEKAGYPVNIRGLEFHGLSHQWMNERGRMRLVVRGEIVNITDDDVPVPEIVFAMMDGKGLEFFQWTERTKSPRLAPFARTRFRAQIPAPADRVRQLKIRFARR